MNEGSLELRLAEVIANMEQRTDSELISVIKDTLMAVGTGQSIESVNEQYKIIYNELDKRLKSQKQNHPNDFDDLWAFYDYWRENKLSTYASRRVFVRNLYKAQKAAQANRHDKWTAIHPVIAGVAKPRFDSGLYADSVEASFKEINSRIKEEVRQRTGKIYDGADLMSNAFSLKNPVIILDDLTTEDGQSVQKGYMMMYMGAIIAIRNPNAHANNSIEPDEAMPLIHIASHLFSKFENAVQRDKNDDAASTTKGVYVRIKNPDDHQKLLALKMIALAHPGSTAIILVLGEGERSAIRLPFTVAPSIVRSEDLIKLLGEDNIVAK